MYFPAGNHTFTLRTGVRLWLPQGASAVLVAGKDIFSLPGFQYTCFLKTNWEYHDAIWATCVVWSKEPMIVPEGSEIVMMRVTSDVPLNNELEEYPQEE